MLETEIEIEKIFIDKNNKYQSLVNYLNDNSLKSLFKYNLCLKIQEDENNLENLIELSVKYMNHI